MRLCNVGSMKLLALGVLGLACTPSTTAQPEPEVVAPPAEAQRAEPTAEKVTPPAPPQEGAPCGELGCRAYSSAALAFQAVLDEEKPLVLGLGEAHAQKGTEHIASSVKRFTADLLPLLQGRASDLIVELLVPDGTCVAKEKQVKKQQEKVTKPQAKENQNEYVALGHAAKKLGVIPDVLRPSCQDLDAITKAGGNDVAVMLETIERLTEKKVKELLAANAKAGKQSVVVAYGGALHNDLEPREGMAAWSYGPAFAEHTGQRYVELDLIVPEYIKDTDSWNAQAWVKHYDPKQHGARATLFKQGPKRWVLVFPVTTAE